MNSSAVCLPRTSHYEDAVEIEIPLNKDIQEYQRRLRIRNNRRYRNTLNGRTDGRSDAGVLETLFEDRVLASSPLGRRAVKIRHVAHPTFL